MRLIATLFCAAVLLTASTVCFAQEGKVSPLKLKKATKAKEYRSAPLVPAALEKLSAKRKQKQAKLEQHHEQINVNKIIEKIAGKDGLQDFKKKSSFTNPMEIPERATQAETAVAENTDTISFTKKSVNTGGIASTVCEPSAAISKDGCVLVTGNWFASFSSDNGDSFSFIDPSDFFPEDDFSFCCDQVVHYVEKVPGSEDDMMIWFLQYSDNGSENIFRIAIAKGDGIKNQEWIFYDFKPTDFNSSWTDQWFDYPDLAVNENNLFITSNVFNVDDAGGGFERAVIVRLPLAQLHAGAAVDAEFFDSDDAFSFRPTQGAGDTMYFGSHDFANFESGIKLYSWKDSLSDVKTDTIGAAEGLHTWLNKGNSRISIDKDGNSWLKRADFRMTGSWFENDSNVVGLAWCAAGDTSRKNPHIRVVRIDVSDPSDLKIVNQPHIHHSLYGFAYPAMASNKNGKVGISVAYGGGGDDDDAKNASHAVGVFKDGNWLLTEVATSTHGPTGEQWGDYLSVRPHPKNPASWISTGYVINGGGQSANIKPHIAFFNNSGIVPPPPNFQELVDSLEATANNLEQELGVLRQAIEDLKVRINDQ